jgi:hypothetical protein
MVNAVMMCAREENKTRKEFDAWLRRLNFKYNAGERKNRKLHINTAPNKEEELGT